MLVSIFGPVILVSIIDFRAVQLHSIMTSTSIACHAEAISKSLQRNRSFEISSRVAFHGGLCNSFLNIFVVPGGVPGPG